MYNMDACCCSWLHLICCGLWLFCPMMPCDSCLSCLLRSHGSHEAPAASILGPLKEISGVLDVHQQQLCWFLD